MKIRTNHRLLELVSREVYSYHILILFIRENLQNAYDACRKKGVVPDIRFTLDLDTDKKGFTAVCEDNGCGMTLSEMENGFLTIGGSTKLDGEGVGGFGWATAINLRAEHVSVLSQNVFYQNPGDNEDPIEIGGYRDGTIITGRYNQSWTIYTLQRALEILHLSDPIVHVTIKHGGDIAWEGSLGGILDQGEWAEMTSGDVGAVKYRVISQPSVCLPEITIGHDRAGGGKPIEYPYVRIKGLCQFMRDDVMSGDVLFLVDIQEAPAPCHEGYPLTSSREGFSGEFRNKMQRILQGYAQNPITTRNAVIRASQPDPVLVIPGLFINPSGEGLTDEGRMVDVDNLGGEGPDLIGAYHPLEVSGSVQMPAKNLGTVGASPFDVEILLHKYRRSQISKTDYGILAAWAQILMLMCREEETFGVGLTSDSGLNAERMVWKGRVYYVINPSSVKDMGVSVLKILYMAFLAAHELAHAREGNHSEYFTTHHSTIFKDGIGKVFRQVPLLRKLLVLKARFQWFFSEDTEQKPKGAML